MEAKYFSSAPADEDRAVQEKLQNFNWSHFKFVPDEKKSVTIEGATMYHADIEKIIHGRITILGQMSHMPCVLKRSCQSNRGFVQLAISDIARECQILRSLRSHDHVIKLMGIVKDQCHDACKNGNKCIKIVMESGGVSLETLRGPISRAVRKENILANFCGQVISALQHIHNCGFIFFDLKPHNIAVQVDADPSVSPEELARQLETAKIKLIDVGSARRFQSMVKVAILRTTGGLALREETAGCNHLAKLIADVGFDLKHIHVRYHRQLRQDHQLAKPFPRNMAEKKLVEVEPELMEDLEKHAEQVGYDIEVHIVLRDKSDEERARDIPTLSYRGAGNEKVTFEFPAPVDTRLKFYGRGYTNIHVKDVGIWSDPDYFGTNEIHAASVTPITPHYTAPEVLKRTESKGDSYTDSFEPGGETEPNNFQFIVSDDLTKTDVYTLGMTVWDLLHGFAPYSDLKLQRPSSTEDEAYDTIIQKEKYRHLGLQDETEIEHFKKFFLNALRYGESSDQAFKHARAAGLAFHAHLHIDCFDPKHGISKSHELSRLYIIDQSKIIPKQTIFNEAFFNGCCSINPDNRWTCGEVEEYLAANAAEAKAVEALAAEAKAAEAAAKKTKLLDKNPLGLGPQTRDILRKQIRPPQ